MNNPAPVRKRNIWAQAGSLAAQTPDSRNRYVDFLRALSIGAVVIGHWLMAAPYFEDGVFTIGHMLAHQQWTRWLTWALQVMPVFFLVGGYANGVSWQSAQQNGQPYNSWLAARLQRLIGPVLPLLVMWIILAAGAQWLGLRPDMVSAASRMALIPLWFLAVYLMVVVFVPLTYAAWQRYGLWSFWVLVVAAVVDDYLFFAADLRALGWFNYVFVWFAVHQLGYAWRHGYLAGVRKGWKWVLGGGAVLVGLITFGPYPASMVGVPGQEISNSQPPKVALLVLGVVQCGLLLSVEAPMRRWLARASSWTAVVLVNSMIMTIFLWHLTASTLAIGCALWLNGIGLQAYPGSAAWWAIRPLWLLGYLLALLPFALAFGRFERGNIGDRIFSPWRLLTGAALICAGLSLLARDGVVGEGWLGIRAGVVALPFIGALITGVNPLRK